VVASSLYEIREVNTKNLDSTLIASHFENVELISKILNIERLAGSVENMW